MMNRLLKTTAFTVGLVALVLPGTKASVYTVSDDRIRNLDITPVLGRGYSIMTNTFQSTCLMVDETTVPSYNYEYIFTDFTEDTDSSSQSSSQSQSQSSRWKFKWSWKRGPSLTRIEQERENQASSSSKVKTTSRMIATTMRIERYYSSLREEVSPLSLSAKRLLEDQDYVGFFKACGPNYTRGIRRMQEVTAIMKFRSSSSERASQFMSKFKERKTTWSFRGRRDTSRGSSNTGASKFKSINKDLTISIVGYGLGLSQEGSDTLVAQTMDEFDGVMKFAFHSMTRNEDAYHIGMVYGIEVVPWVHNTAFQVAAKLGDESIEIPMPRSLIPRAFTIISGSNTAWANDVLTRELFRCKDATLLPDKYGYCCEIEQMYSPITSEYTGVGAEPINHVCRPIRSLDPSLIKDNMSNNGEFIARLDAAFRYKVLALSTLEKCISSANSFPEEFLFNKLIAQASVKYDSVIETVVSLAQLKLAIDPKGDYSVVKHMSRELDEWIDMYYTPCYAALFGANVGTTSDIEPSYFMAYPWYSHPECMHLTCLTNNMRWDRDLGGCIPSLITGSDADGYDSNADSQCSKKLDEYDNESCKYNQTELGNFTDSVKDCWDDLPISQVDYMINHFCMPDVSRVSITDAEITALNATMIACKA